VQQRFGRLDIAVVNAGILALRPTVEMDLATWQRVIDVNLTGAFLTAKVCAAAMIAQGHGGRVIFTGSLMAQRGAAENCAYSASKFGVLGLMQTLAIELAPRGITVNAVNPGQIQTEMLDQLFTERAELRGKTAEELRAQTLQHIAVGRLGQPSEVADAYVFLASELSTYITGQSLSVEGGWMLL
jgi:NAD(P)-dependent dehydrogenase (short-subunit alcohol dehydrogenase family)